MKKLNLTIALVSLASGFFLGTSTLGSATADDTTVATVPQGDVLKVCIEKKTGVIRAASTCKKSERSYVLGGPGPQGTQGVKGDVGSTGPQGTQGQAGPQGIQGIKGDTGLTGLQGIQGFTGLTGPAGTVSGLRTKSITVWEQSYLSSCGGYTGFNALNGNTSISTYGSTISLNKSCSTLYPSSVTVYTP